MRLVNLEKDLSISPAIERLLFALAIIVIIFLYPYFVWKDFENIHRVSHFVGIVIILYIVIKHHEYDIYNIETALLFIVVSIYSMVAGTEIHKYTYIHFLTFLFIVLKPSEQLRVFDFVVTLLSVIYAVGLLSYLLSILGINIPLGQAIAPNAYKSPYIIYFGHLEETGLPVYRFSSIFDEAGLVGTLNGLILSAYGISTRNIKSIIILLAGLFSFSLAFYIILGFNVLFNLNLKKALIVLVVFILIYPVARNRINYLIASRIAIKEGRIAGDNRSHPEFDNYYKLFLSSGGKDLILGKGVGYSHVRKESWQVSSYKLLIIDFGILGIALMVGFYAFCTAFFNNSKKGWFLFFIFMISMYQRPDLIIFFNVALFLGGLRYLKYSPEIQ